MSIELGRSDPTKRSTVETNGPASQEPLRGPSHAQLRHAIEVAQDRITPDLANRFAAMLVDGQSSTSDLARSIVDLIVARQGSQSFPFIDHPAIVRVIDASLQLPSAHLVALLAHQDGPALIARAVGTTLVRARESKEDFDTAAYEALRRLRAHRDVEAITVALPKQDLWLGLNACSCLAHDIANRIDELVEASARQVAGDGPLDATSIFEGLRVPFSARFAIHSGILDRELKTILAKHPEASKAPGIEDLLRRAVVTTAALLEVRGRTSKPSLGTAEVAHRVMKSVAGGDTPALRSLVHEVAAKTKAVLDDPGRFMPDDPPTKNSDAFADRLLDDLTTKWMTRLDGRLPAIHLIAEDESFAAAMKAGAAKIEAHLLRQGHALPALDDSLTGRQWSVVAASAINAAVQDLHNGGQGRPREYLAQRIQAHEKMSSKHAADSNDDDPLNTLPSLSAAALILAAEFAPVLKAMPRASFERLASDFRASKYKL